ncbi:MAG TPA: decarboxylating 6-phosphogluconate dehydrogenase [Gammaproteobacteria bacterium]|nr:decarboxylating 6-phosphogluconate dehydrogenase [Gammaproteobacteria bacterium]
MRLAMVGLGKMGANMARRLARAGIEVVGYNRSQQIVQELASQEGIVPAASLEEVVEKLTPPRVVWLMLPSGSTTDEAVEKMTGLLDKGDIVVDGGNSNYHDSMRHGATLSEHGIGFADAGTSGGIWGLAEGYCLMVGGAPQVIETLTPALKALAPSPDHGWAHVGPVGAGHFTKMVHNGIEYGMMQAMAEGFSLLRGKSEFSLDLAQISEVWRYGSVVRSWLLDLTADALKEDQVLDGLAPYVADSGEGRWTAIEAIDQGVAAPVMTTALYMRFISQDEKGYPFRMLSMMRNAFGGHNMKKAGGK